jgi:pentose-5-phosphate-3-epimerase
VTIKSAPSILAANFARLGKEVRAIELVDADQPAPDRARGRWSHTPATAGAAAAAGAGVIVAGSSIFRSADYAAAIAELRARALSGASGHLR